MRAKRPTRPQSRTRTLHGHRVVPRPPAPPEATSVDLAPVFADEGDTIVVDVEVNAAGQIVITGAERVP